MLEGAEEDDLPPCLSALVGGCRGQTTHSRRELASVRAEITESAARTPSAGSVGGRCSRRTVADHSQGVPLAMMQDLARYWRTEYDWRRCEAELNALPQFITEIDGVDIHLIHVR